MNAAQEPHGAPLKRRYDAKGNGGRNVRDVIGSNASPIIIIAELTRAGFYGYKPYLPGTGIIRGRLLFIQTQPETIRTGTVKPNRNRRLVGSIHHGSQYNRSAERALQGDVDERTNRTVNYSCLKSPPAGKRMDSFIYNEISHGFWRMNAILIRPFLEHQPEPVGSDVGNSHRYRIAIVLAGDRGNNHGTRIHTQVHINPEPRMIDLRGPMLIYRRGGRIGFRHGFFRDNRISEHEFVTSSGTGHHQTNIVGSGINVCVYDNRAPIRIAVAVTHVPVSSIDNSLAHVRQSHGQRSLAAVFVGNEAGNERFRYGSAYLVRKIAA
ncbi:MAG: hypothetical protein EOM20_18535 [Spartobacteria bacterium]|nr:hypothetical protein [Spartobacteria bacterium]